MKIDIDSVSLPKKQRIMLVEDDPQISEIVNAILDGKFEVVRMQSGEDAVKEFQRSSFDLIFMDLHLAGMDGYETTLRIRAMERGENRQQVPIVAFTGNITKENRKRFFEYGIDDYLSKPFFRETIFPTLYRNLEKAKKPAANMLSN